MKKKMKKKSEIYTIKVGPPAAAAAAAAAADQMRPTEKHAKIQLDSDDFRHRPTGRSATAKKDKIPLVSDVFWCSIFATGVDRRRPVLKLDKVGKNTTRI